MPDLCNLLLVGIYLPHSYLNWYANQRQWILPLELFSKLSGTHDIPFIRILIWCNQIDITRRTCHNLLLSCFRRWRWTEVTFSPVSLFVCEQDISNSWKSEKNLVHRLGAWQGRIDSILVKIRIRDFFFYSKVILHHWEIWPKTIHSMTSQNVVDGWQN